MFRANLTIFPGKCIRPICVCIFLLAAVARSLCQEDAAQDSETTEAAAPLKEDDDGYAQIELLLRAMEIVRENYVDESKVSYESLVNNALAGMLSALDPHSQFLYPELYEQVKETLDEGTYDGVGIAVAPKDGALSIVSVREDGPAARAGVFITLMVLFCSMGRKSVTAPGFGVTPPITL